MIISYKDKIAVSIVGGEKPKKFPQDLVKVARRKLAMLEAAVELNDLRIPPANHLEALKGNRKGQYSIRINRQWRVCFVWTEKGPSEVEIVDYHKG